MAQAYVFQIESISWAIAMAGGEPSKKGDETQHQHQDDLLCLCVPRPNCNEKWPALDLQDERMPQCIYQSVFNT